MNVRRGLWRLWIAITIAYVGGATIFSWPMVAAEIRKVERYEARPAPIPDAPNWMCFSAGYGDTVIGLPVDPEVAEFQKGCKRQMAEFRSLHPEFNNSTDEDIGKAVREAAIPTGHPWRVAGKIVMEAFALPILLLIAGAVVAWIWRGFREPKQPQADQ